MPTWQNLTSPWMRVMTQMGNQQALKKQIRIHERRTVYKYKGRTVLGSQLRLNKAKDISELLSQCYLLFVAEEFLFNEANGAPATQGKHSEIIDLRQEVTYRKNREQKTHDSLSWQEEFQSYAQVLVFPLNPRQGKNMGLDNNSRLDRSQIISQLQQFRLEEVLNQYSTYVYSFWPCQ